jgi:hypothetical protein
LRFSPCLSDWLSPITCVRDGLFLGPGSGNLDAVARNAERFQQVRGKIRIANAAAAGPVTPNESVEIPANQLHAPVGLPFEGSESGRAVGERDIVGQGELAGGDRDHQKKGSLHDLTLRSHLNFSRSLGRLGRDRLNRGV